MFDAGERLWKWQIVLVGNTTEVSLAPIQGFPIKYQHPKDAAVQCILQLQPENVIRLNQIISGNSKPPKESETTPTCQSKQPEPRSSPTISLNKTLSG